MILGMEEEPILVVDGGGLLDAMIEVPNSGLQFANNGNEAISSYKVSHKVCDVVLMDLQMPLCDGFEATRGIRSFERPLSFKEYDLPESRIMNGNRVVVFAVSASLPESRSGELIAAGFNGWILKPINFQRMRGLLNGIWDLTVRRASTYPIDSDQQDCALQEYNWELGGWLA